MSASRSAGVVGRWGSTSFTSLRAGSGGGGAANGENAGAHSEPQIQAPAAPKPRSNKFFKNRNRPQNEEREGMKRMSWIDLYYIDEFNLALGYDSISEVTPIIPSTPSEPASTASSRPRNRFFTSKTPKTTVPPPPAPSSPPPPPSQAPVSVIQDDLRIPPLKLRIKTPVAPQSSKMVATDAQYKRAEAESSESEHSQGVDSVKSDDGEEPIDDGDATESPGVPEVETYSRKRGYEESKSVQSYSRRRTRNASGKNGSDLKKEEPVLPVVEEEPQSPPEAVPEPKKKSVIDDWDSDDDDPEISFKDDSLVIKSPKAKDSSAVLSRAATIASSVKVEDEIKATTSDTPGASKSAPDSQDDAPQPVKKRSIFKSKANGKGGSGKGLSLYKHKFGAGHEQDQDEFKREVFTRAVFGGGSSKTSSR